MPSSSEEYGNRSVMAGFSLLAALASIGRAATLGEIAGAVKMTGSRTHRFLAGLQKVGAVSQDPESGKYDLGPGLIELGVTALGRVDIVRRASDAIEDLAEATGLVALVCAWGSNGPTVIKWTQGNRISSIHVPEGVNLPLLTTATGNIFLVYLPREKTKHFLEQEIGRAGVSRKSVDSDVERIMVSVRAKGAAYSSGKAHPNLVKLAAPVFQWNGDLALVVTLIGDATVTDMNADSATAQTLKAATQRLSQVNGYSGRPERTGKGAPAALEKPDAA
jgi:DNA-binding IclR family transcriptional regulator